MKSSNLNLFFNSASALYSELNFIALTEISYIMSKIYPISNLLSSEKAYENYLDFQSFHLLHDSWKSALVNAYG
jgi:hypothetical protein